MSNPFSFVRTDRSHQAAASATWSASGGTHTWVGEWHTHPSGGVCPSAVDRSSWARLSKSIGLPMAFVLVVPGEWGVFVVRPALLRRRAIRAQFVETGGLGLVFRAGGS